VAALGQTTAVAPPLLRESARRADVTFDALDKPGPTPLGNGQFQAPHVVVLVFARGLLRHLITRVYFEHEAANAVDPVLLTIPEERRHTLIARSDADCPQALQWNVILQGDNETVFFAW